MCLALTALGYDNVYHGIDAIDNVQDFEVFGRAADALFPSLPSYNGRGMTASDWDAVFGRCEAVTDLAGPFAESLIASYPDAKVVLVVRDYERWSPSFADMLSGIFGRVTSFIKHYVEPLTGDRTTGNVQKMLLGWARARDLDDLLARRAELYARHNDGVRAMVPGDRLLVYRLGDGWGPLCEFLGRDVPDVPFPHGNEAAALRRIIFYKQLRTFRSAGAILGPYVACAVAVGFVAWMALARA